MQIRPRSSAAQTNRQTYIPPAVQQSMNQQLQRTAPGHLKKYVGTGAYVPQHAQKALEQHMRQAAPGHLKQYAGAFVQQNVVQPGLSAPAGSAATPVPNQAPLPNKLRLDHSNVPGAQYEAQFNTLFQSDQPGQSNQSAYADTGQPQQTGGAYDFILSSQQPERRFNLPGGGNKLVKTAFISGALLLLLILFVIIRSIFSSGPDWSPYVSVAQDQQALIQLAQTAAEQKDLSTANKNYTYTAQLSLLSAQTELLAYLKNQSHEVDKKRLNLKVSTAVGTQLTNALAAGNYNRTYHDLAESKLNTYINDLNRAYETSSGQKGRALLKSHYAQAQLLLKQLNAPAN